MPDTDTTLLRLRFAIIWSMSMSPFVTLYSYSIFRLVSSHHKPYPSPNIRKKVSGPMKLGAIARIKKVIIIKPIIEAIIINKSLAVFFLAIICSTNTSTRNLSFYSSRRCRALIRREKFSLFLIIHATGNNFNCSGATSFAAGIVQAAPLIRM